MFLKRLVRYVVVGITILCLSLNAGLSNASDADNDGIDDGEEQALAEKYAPILYFEGKEEVYPVSIAYALSSSNLNQSNEGVPTLIYENPTVGQLSHYTDTGGNYYLDNRKGTIDDDRIIKDYRENMENLGYTVYSHVFKQGNETIIQYWMFYVFNKGTLNTHEGDWEMVQIILNGENQPAEAMYSQHVSGQKAKWNQVEKSGDHPKVYVARGSHANYFRYYQGKLGLASDYVGKNGRVLKIDDYNMVILGEKGGNHISEQGWIDFAGRWGDFGSNESEIRGERGPCGPAYREDGNMWAGMIWGNSLPSLNKNVLAADWIFYHFNMLYLAVLAASLAFILFGIYRRRKGLEKPFFYILKIDGVNAKSIGNILAVVGIVLVVTSLFYPWYGVSVDAQTGSYKTPGLTEIISIDGLKGMQINLLDENSGVIQAGAVPIAFSLLIGASILLFILGTIGLDSKKAGRKYMVRGIKFIIPVILIIVTVMSFSLLAFQLNESGASEGAEEDAGKIINTISSHPLGGDNTLLLPEYGTVYVTWGMKSGAFLLIASGIALIVSGAIQMMAGDKRMKEMRAAEEI